MTAASVTATASAIDALKALLGTRASTASAVLHHHSHGEANYPAAAPHVVCFPVSTDEVAAIVRISRDFGLPVIPFGAGSSLEGHVHALHGGITISLRDMNKVVRLSADDLDVTVEAGVTRLQLDRALRATGLAFFIDPGADCTLGGMASTRASGTTAVRYGTMRENVLALTVVLASGEIIRTGTRARKSSAGYDLTRLFVGAEGTLGVITEVTLRLHPRPEAVSTALCGFDTLRGAVRTVIETIQLGIPVARVEIMDERQIDAINRYSKTSWTEAPTLLFEFHGPSEAAVAAEAAAVQEIAAEHGSRGFEWHTRLEDRERLWAARHSAFLASIAMRPGAKAWATDVCVPISRLADCILESHDDNAGAPFPITLVGHVGDGNFHLAYVLDPASATEAEYASRLHERLVARALAMGGTCTGEHGIGYGKLKYMEAEHGPALEVMRSIKRALDPDNRMNPGKVVVV